MPAADPSDTSVVVPGAPVPPADPSATDDAPPPAPPKRRRIIGWVIAVVLLVLALAATAVFLYLTLQRLEEANQEIKEQQELIDKKETFASAAEELQATAAQFDGVPYATLLKRDYYESLLGRGWTHRWNGVALDQDTKDVLKATAKLEETLAAAAAQASSNATGSIYESLTDSLGSGYVATSLDTADSACEQDVWGCVNGEDPFTIHYDNAETAGQPYMNDFLRTGLAYHEYAHVLQMTNPGPTETAAEAFGGDWETMADCYALTYLPGWSLDHTIWVSDYEYWEVSVGYGYTCTPDQAQVVRDWVSQLGYHHEPISQ